MKEYLQSLTNINIPYWVFIVLVVAIILVAFLFYWYMRTRIFKRRLLKIIKTRNAPQAEEALKIFAQHYPPEKLVRYSRRMERYSRQWGPRVVRETGLAKKWEEKLTNSQLVHASDLRRVLLYCPSTSVFKAFITATQYPRLRSQFSKWMQKEGEEKIIRLLAESCRGENFDPSFAKSFLKDHAIFLRELTGEAEWYTRYFAYKILLLDSSVPSANEEASASEEDVLSQRSLNDGLMDPHSLIRMILTENYKASREKTWEVLWDKLIHDPVYEVRKAARKRIAKEFTNLYNLKDKFLNITECSRVLELLDTDSQEDRAFAMKTLESPNRELCFPAAVFLEKCGILSSILAKNTLDDQSGIEHCVNLLRKATEVNVCGFLNGYPSGDGGPLLVAANLLSGPDGNSENILYLEEKVFTFFNNKKIDPANKKIYTRTLDAIAESGNIRTLELFAEELSRRENDPVFLDLLLPRIPGRASSLILPILFRFVENTSFSAREELISILKTFSPDLILPRLFTILNANRTDYPHIVRITALKILGRLNLPFCLQRILESLPTLRAEETEEFASLVTEYPKHILEEKARELLALPDARIRASIISILPVTKNESFIREIRSALKDVDPDVRVAAIKALLGFGEIRLLNQETSMLRDPVERVRLATAKVIAEHGNSGAMSILKSILDDPSETDVVKIGVITGLGEALNAEGISILIDVLDSAGTFVPVGTSVPVDTKVSVTAKASGDSEENIDLLGKFAEKALIMRTTKRDIIQLIESFKDASPQLREKLIPVFKAQGKAAEPWIVEILKEEIASLKPYLTTILEGTGYVDEVKRRLSHRDVETRREAAMLLSLMDTLPAFRGLVLAAKDPDQEVRVCVVKALEKLKNQESYEMLEKLKDDPDNRIRRYTHWALERLDSLGME